MISADYEADHVTYDGHDTPLTIHCLRCHAVIGRRAEIPTRNPGVMVHSLVRAPNYREVYAELSDGSVCYFPFCQDCIRQPIDPDAALESVKRGWEKALIEAGRPPQAIQDQRTKVADLAVLKVTGEK